MKYVRIKFNGQPSWGELSHESVHLLDQAPYEGGQKTGKVLALSDCELLAPCQPSKIVAVGKNYHDHIKEFDAQVPERPILFIKPSTAIQDPGKPIVLPSRMLSSRVDYEGELALVIGKKASHIAVADAAQYILGYTILNDVTSRDLQKLDGQWTRAKGFDTFAPVGPLLTDEVDPANLQITTTLNGHVRQQESTAQLIPRASGIHHPGHDLAAWGYCDDGHPGRGRPDAGFGYGGRDHRRDRHLGKSGHRQSLSAGLNLKAPCGMILLLDHYDSFTDNLARYFQQLGIRIDLREPDRIVPADLNPAHYRGLVLSPGPGRPEQATVALQLLERWAGRLPILGICLGHQVIAHFFQAAVV